MIIWFPSFFSPSAPSAPLRPPAARQGKRAKEVVIKTPKCTDGHGFPFAAGGIQWEPAGLYIISAFHPPALHLLRRPRRVAAPVISPPHLGVLSFPKGTTTSMILGSQSRATGRHLALKKWKGFNVRPSILTQQTFCMGRIWNKKVGNSLRGQTVVCVPDMNVCSMLWVCDSSEYLDERICLNICTKIMVYLAKNEELQ